LRSGGRNRNVNMKKIVEVFRMTDVYKMIVNDKVFEIAKKLLKKGISVEDVADSTEFDIDTIEALKEQLEQGIEEEN